MLIPLTIHSYVVLLGKWLQQISYCSQPQLDVVMQHTSEPIFDKTMNLGAAVGLVSLAINNLKVIENELGEKYMGTTFEASFKGYNGIKASDSANMNI
jgi:hypothetical protein